MRRWTLEDAQVRLGEVVRQARSSGPQLVTVDGKEAVVIIAAAEAAEFAEIVRPELPFVDFMASLALGDIDVTRDPDTGRDVSL